ncbi:MAG: hypothetical protein IJT39_05860 [Bacteroidales bacterium]|nr:hypothetical protein [Bacteroidales bacterium]
MKCRVALAVVIVCSFSVLYAQNTNLNPDIQVNKDSVEEVSSHSCFHRFLHRVFDKKATPSPAIDSVLIYKDSVAVLNENIKSMRRTHNAEVEKLKIENADLQRKINQCNKAIKSNIIDMFGQHLFDADQFFCRAVMESPLFYKYNKERVDFSLDVSKTMGYDQKNNEMFFIYSIYNNLLINYNTYNQELIDNVEAIISQFSMGVANREFEKNRFEDRLQKTSYYKVRGKGEYGDYKHIFYLDFQIERLRGLFESDLDFKKDNFEKILNVLREK